MEKVEKGHLTVMWNILYDNALQQNYDYFFQCGDDIEFNTSNLFIHHLILEAYQRLIKSVQNDGKIF